jgi:hypothetical protein
VKLKFPEELVIEPVPLKTNITNKGDGPVLKKADSDGHGRSSAESGNRHKDRIAEDARSNAASKCKPSLPGYNRDVLSQGTFRR